MKHVSENMYFTKGSSRDSYYQSKQLSVTEGNSINQTSLSISHFYDTKILYQEYRTMNQKYNKMKQLSEMLGALEPMHLSD